MTLGIAGFFDVANSWFNLPMRYHQDFAVTLHKWGVYKRLCITVYSLANFWSWNYIGISDSVDALFNPLSYLFLAPG